MHESRHASQWMSVATFWVLCVLIRYESCLACMSQMNASYHIQPIADRAAQNLEIISKENQRTRILPMGFTIGCT